MRRRIVGRGFEGFELPQARGWRPSADDMDLLQGQEMPRRRLVAQVPERGRGPEAFGQPFGQGRGLLDRPDAQNVGRSVDINLTAVSTAAANILNLTGDDEHAQVYTLTFWFQHVNPAAGDFVTSLVALLSWGSGGVQYTATVDFQMGTVVQLCASSIRIDVRGQGQGTAKCMVQIGYGASGERKAQSTSRLAAIAMGVTEAPLAIPQFANRCQAQRTPATANFVVDFLNRASVVLSSFTIGNGPGSGSEILWIPAGASHWRITNGLSADIDRLNMVFGLNL